MAWCWLARYSAIAYWDSRYGIFLVLCGAGAHAAPVCTGAAQKIWNPEHNKIGLGVASAQDRFLFILADFDPRFAL